MTPAASAAAKAGLRRSPAPRAPRRTSGPARPGATRQRSRAAASPAAGRALAVAMRIGDARLLDRLVRGRAWIAILAVGLLGLVFLQVSMLKLNAGVSRAVTSADTLERQNSLLRQQIAELSADERVVDFAAANGMTTPYAGDVRYLDAKAASAGRAARSIVAPTPVVTQEQIAAATATTQAMAADTPTDGVVAASDDAGLEGAATQAEAGADPAVAEQAGTTTTAGATEEQQQPAGEQPATENGAATPEQVQADTTSTAPAQVGGGAEAPQG